MRDDHWTREQYLTAHKALRTLQSLADELDSIGLQGYDTIIPAITRLSTPMIFSGHRFTSCHKTWREGAWRIAPHDWVLFTSAQYRIPRTGRSTYYMHHYVYHTGEYCPSTSHRGRHRHLQFNLG